MKNSFVVELSDGHRKLRHLFLFNDVIACAKYKASGRDKFTFELKWYVSLGEAVVSEDSGEPREASPANVVALRYAEMIHLESSQSIETFLFFFSDLRLAQ